MIVFYELADDGNRRVSGGPSGRFAVRDGAVLPVVGDGIVLPAQIDVAGFKALLGTAL